MKGHADQRVWRAAFQNLAGGGVRQRSQDWQAFSERYGTRPACSERHQSELLFCPSV
jgi:hypothetical protein